MITVGSRHTSKRSADFSVIGWALSCVKKKSWVLTESKRNSNFTAKNWHTTRLAYQLIIRTLIFYPVILRDYFGLSPIALGIRTFHHVPEHMTQL